MHRLAYVALMLLLAAGPAGAHPHVIVDVKTDLLLNAAGQVTGLRQHWLFDKNYTEAALEDMDTNHDGTFTSAELRPLTDENIKSLREYDYFTVVRQKGERVETSAPIDTDQTWSKGLLTLHFTLPFKHPLDPRKSEVVAKIYDPDFFISFALAAHNAARLEGNAPAGCAVTVKPVPTDAELESTRTMLATKGVDWQPENNEDFGALFAQPITLSCAS